jgi:hypothetical protein
MNVKPRRIKISPLTTNFDSEIVSDGKCKIEAGEAGKFWFAAAVTFVL